MTLKLDKPPPPKAGIPATIDDAIASIPTNYRLYSMDASIVGRFRVMLTLAEPDRQAWFDTGE
jgi:hypothetical protein